MQPETCNLGYLIMYVVKYEIFILSHPENSGRLNINLIINNIVLNSTTGFI